MSPVLQRALEASAAEPQGHLDLPTPAPQGRGGVCVCGRAVADHFTSSRRFISCASLAMGDRLFDLPVVLHLADMAKLLDKSERVIKALLRDGTFPIPHIERAPWPMWHRRDVLRWAGKTTYAPLERARAADEEVAASHG